jgi:hypothetical protein
VVVDEEQALAISKVIAPDSDIRVELGVPPSAEVHFIGRPILALDPRFNNGTVPARFLHHPLVEGRYLFALPRPLWDSVYSKIGQDAFDPEAVELELKLSDMCGDASFNVGLWQGRVLAYNLLRESPLDLSSAECAAILKKSKAQLDFLARAYEDRVKVFHRITRAYVGWLLTNSDFLDEHDALLSEWSQMVQRWGLNRLGTPAMTGMFLPGEDPAADPSWPRYKSGVQRVLHSLATAETRCAVHPHSAAASDGWERSIVDRFATEQLRRRFLHARHVSSSQPRHPPQPPG